MPAAKRELSLGKKADGELFAVCLRSATKRTVTEEKVKWQKKQRKRWD
jgi:hypothetical protein